MALKIRRNYEPQYGHAIAIFDESEAYRYALSRHWNVTLPLVNFLCLNPSTADELQLDPTLKKCAKYARRWGYGGMIITNVFAFRATDPGDMKRADEPIGERNDWFIRLAATVSDRVICAWGQHATHLDRAQAIKALLTADAAIASKLHYLKITKEPWHPLYLRDALDPTPWSPSA